MNNSAWIPDLKLISNSNRLFAWGWSAIGQLGDGTTIDRHVPTLIGTDTWNMIFAGRYHSLGIPF